MDMKKLIQQMTDLEGSQTKNTQLNEETQVSISGNSGEEVANMITALQGKAGINSSPMDSGPTAPMRQDMERLRGIVDEPEIPGNDDVPGDQDVNAGAMGAVAGGVAGAALGGPLGALTGAAAGDSLTDDELEEYENEPEEEYSDHHYMTKDLSGGINRRKKSYADAEDGDNPMAVEADGVSDADRNPSIERSKYKSNNGIRKPSDSDNEKKDKERGLPMDDMSIAKRKKERAMGETSLEHDLKSKLYAALSEKKAKPDYIDIDGDGDKKEPMKKAVKDKKSKKKEVK